MGTTPSETLVFRDQDGNYYELSPEVLVRARVSEERKVEIERALGDDTAGFLNFAQPATSTLPAVQLPSSLNLITTQVIRQY